MIKRKTAKLLLVKVLHTAIWASFVFVILYILYSGIYDRINLLTWVAIALIVAEGIVLLICRWRCPLTLIAKKYADNHVVGFDIFLPGWLAKHNKTIFTSLYLISVILVIYRTWQGRA
jgi:hypothetical protein